MGIGFYSLPPLNNFREYIEGTLIDTLINGHIYLVSFYVSAPENCKYKTDAIGAYLSTDTIGDNTSNLVLSNYIPQVENTVGNILMDSVNWMLISGYFTAQGGEKFITIGNFKDDAHTTLDTIPNTTIHGGYYYIDDVSVIDCTATGIAEINNNLNISITPNPTQNKISITSNCKINNITLLNTLGEIVLQQQLNESKNKIILDVAVLPKGIYFLKCISHKRNAIKKFVKI